MPNQNLMIFRIQVADGSMLLTCQTLLLQNTKSFRAYNFNRKPLWVCDRITIHRTPEDPPRNP